MKKLLLVLLVSGMLATTANAAQLYMQFAGGQTEITVNPSDEIVVEIWFGNMQTSDTLSTVFHGNASAPGLDQIASVALLTNWSAGGGNTVLGTNQFAVAADNPLEDSVSGPGAYHVGNQIIHQNDLLGDYEIMFGAAGPLAKVKDASGADYKYWGSDGGWAGYYSYGTGAPYYAGNPKTGDPVQLADPLIVHCVPEPGSLSLLALGGLALIRRR